MIHSDGDEREEEQGEGDKLVLDGLHKLNLLLTLTFFQVSPIYEDYFFLSNIDTPHA